MVFLLAFKLHLLEAPRMVCPEKCSRRGFRDRVQHGKTVSLRSWWLFGVCTALWHGLRSDLYPGAAAALQKQGLRSPEDRRETEKRLCSTCSEVHTCPCNKRLHTIIYYCMLNWWKLQACVAQNTFIQFAKIIFCFVGLFCFGTGNWNQNLCLKSEPVLARQALVPTELYLWPLILWYSFCL